MKTTIEIPDPLWRMAKSHAAARGLSAMAVDLAPKHLEMLAEMAPKLARVAVLVNPGNSGHAALVKNVQGAAKILKIRLSTVSASTADEIERAFASVRR